MSHTATVETELTSTSSIRAACRREKLEKPEHGTHRLYDGKEVTGLAVKLKDWRYPIVCETGTGKVHYDNYKGAWGEIEELNKFRLSYGIAEATITAQKQGLQVFERKNPQTGRTQLVCN